LGGIGTNLVGGLVNLLGVERGTNTHGDTGAEEDVVRDGSNTTVVDLGLFHWLITLHVWLNAIAVVKENKP
jgi:hypothetical protein